MSELHEKGLQFVFGMRRLQGGNEKGEMSMFAEWVTAGARIGFTAFFAVFIFLVCFAVVLGIAGIVGGFIKAGDGE